jgi:hypothetical protein
MGKRKLAATIQGFDHSTSKDCYSSRGISAHLRGWDEGLFIEMRWDERLGRPTYKIYTTNGSNDSGRRELVYERL